MGTVGIMNGFFAAIYKSFQKNTQRSITVEKVWLGPGYGLIYKYSDFKVNTDIVNWHLEASPNHHRQYLAWGQSDGGKRYVENCRTQRCCTLLIPVYCTRNVCELYMQSQTDVVCVKFVQFYLMLSQWYPNLGKSCTCIHSRYKTSVTNREIKLICTLPWRG